MNRYSNKLLKMSPPKRYERFVVEALLDVCQLTIMDAARMVKSSQFHKTLRKRPEMVMHYPPEEWADSIIRQNNLCLK